jgi:hypothetical protein
LRARTSTKPRSQTGTSAPARDDPEFWPVSARLEEFVVGIDSGDERIEKFSVEDQPQILNAVVVGLVGQLGVRDPVLLELIEQEFVHIGQVSPESIVQNLDDAGKALKIEFLLHGDHQVSRRRHEVSCKLPSKVI